MLAIAVSLLFALAGCVAFAVVWSSLATGSRRVRAILAELAAIEGKARVSRPRAAYQPGLAALPPAFAAA